ncbi:Rpn family recombination-promoting nuclease/putative transposase, partial [Candidatus Cardinium sp. cByotN1]
MTKKKEKEKENQDTVHHPHDKFFKQTFGTKSVILSFLEANLPKEIFRQIDQDSLILANREFVSAIGKNSNSDCIFKALIKGTENYIYLNLEHQSSEDPLMLLRFLEYNAQLIRQHLSEHDTTSLPAIINICLYNGNKPYKGPTNLHDLFPNLKQVESYMFAGFQLVDLHTTANEELLNWKQAAGAAMILKQGIHRDFCE